MSALPAHPSRGLSKARADVAFSLVTHLPGLPSYPPWKKPMPLTRLSETLHSLGLLSSLAVFIPHLSFLTSCGKMLFIF